VAKHSYLAPLFDPDVFVSYSHGDPIEGRAPLRDWTQALIQRLQDRLHALETEFDDLRLWMDPLVDPTADLTEELREKASASGVLMKDSRIGSSPRCAAARTSCRSCSTAS
jgi:hypothetical protein